MHDYAQHLIDFNDDYVKKWPFQNWPFVPWRTEEKNLVYLVYGNLERLIFLGIFWKQNFFIKHGCQDESENEDYDQTCRSCTSVLWLLADNGQIDSIEFYTKNDEIKNP